VARMSDHIPDDLSIPPILRRTSPSDDEAVPEISVEAYEKIDRWRDKLDQTAKLNKRKVYERAAADLFLEAEHERNLGAVQAITDAIYFLGRDHTGLCDDDIQYIMDGAKAKAERPINDPTETAVGGISLENFYAYMPMHNYIYVPTREPWPAASVNARLAPMPVLDGKGKQKLDDKGRPEFISASKWLDQNRPVAQMTWAPGEPLIVADRLISHGGWIHRPGEACLNVYHPPTIDSGNAAEADPWLEHVHRVYPNDAEHIIACLAHRVQRPAEKINHARQWRLSSRRGLLARTRHQHIRPQGAATADVGILGHRDRQPLTRGRRARRRA